MRRIILAAVMVLVTISGVTGITLLSASAASAQASCTGSSAYTNAAGHLVFVPTIGSDTHRDNCDLGPGNNGNAVYWLQTTLNHCYGAGLALDGSYGPLTQAAVKHAQRVAGITADGIYGPQTRDHIKWGDASGQCAKL
jgi:peptidoglycan hydrolase-like protein with peptidoglycan-binding domain